MHEFMNYNCLKCNKFSHCNNNDLICISRYRAKQRECESQKQRLEYYIKKTTQLLDDIDELTKINGSLTE